MPNALDDTELAHCRFASLSAYLLVRNFKISEGATKKCTNGRIYVRKAKHVGEVENQREYYDWQETEKVEIYCVNLSN